MMTGRWPHQLSTGLHGPLDETHRPSPSPSPRSGYATAGFVANTTYCGLETGLGRGFAHYEDHHLSLAGVLWTSALGQRVILQTVFRPERRSRRGPTPIPPQGRGVDPAGHARLDRAAGGTALLRIPELLDAHDPYVPPAAFDRRFNHGAGSAADMATLERWFILDKKKLTPRDRSGSSSTPTMTASPTSTSSSACSSTTSSGPADSDNTLVIITADHGEHFGEHAALRACQQPLRRGDPRPPAGLPPRRSTRGADRRDPVSLRDLAATVADVLGLARLAVPRAVARPVLDRRCRRPDEPSLSEVDAPVRSAPEPGPIAGLPRSHEGRCLRELCLHQEWRRARGALRRRVGPDAVARPLRVAAIPSHPRSVPARPRAAPARLKAPRRREGGREDRLSSVPPPSEPYRRISRTRLSSRWFYLEED